MNTNISTAERAAAERNEATGELDIDNYASILAELSATVNNTSDFGIRGTSRADRLRDYARIGYLSSRLIWLESTGLLREELQAHPPAAPVDPVVTQSAEPANGVVVDDARAVADGMIFDPRPYGPFVDWLGRPINRWTPALRDALRNYFASGKSGVPDWGVLAEVLATLVVADNTDDPTNGSLFFFTPGNAATSYELHSILVARNDVDGWTALLPGDW